MKAGIVTLWFATVTDSRLKNMAVEGSVNTQTRDFARPGSPVNGPGAMRPRSAGAPWHRSLAATFAALAFLVYSGTPSVRGQPTNEVEELKRQLRQLQDNFERMQREQR